MARVSGDVRMVDSYGNYEKSDLLKGYVITNKDEDPSGTSYYGFVDTDGYWYVQKVTLTAVTFCRGTTNYSANWTGRAALTYANFDSVF